MRRVFPMVLAFVCASCSPPPTTIVFGHVADFSGPGKATAAQEANGIRLALDDLDAEAAGDKTSRPVAVRQADDHGNPAVALGQRTRLTNVNRVAAFVSSGEVRIPPGPADLDTTPTTDRVLKLGIDPERCGKVLADYLQSKVKPASILLIDPRDDLEGKSAERGFLSAWPAEARPASWRTERLPVDDAGWKRFADENGKGLVVLFDRRAQSTLERPEMWRVEIAVAGPELLRGRLKDQVLPAYLVTAFASDTAVPTTQDFARRYQEKYSTPAEPAAVLAYESVRLATQLARRTPFGFAKSREEGASLGDFDGVCGKYSIAGGVLSRPAFVGRFQAGSMHDIEVDVPAAKK